MNYWEGYYKNEFLYVYVSVLLVLFWVVFQEWGGGGGSETRNAVGRKSTLQFQAKDPRHYSECLVILRAQK